jgi:sugar transferase (PEP-CTERM/EpsH1 system associated)
LPADTGGKIRSLQIFSRLAKREEIHAVSQADPHKDAEGIAEMKQMFASYTPVYWKESVKYSPSFYMDLAVNHFSSYPYFIAKFCHPKFTRALTALAQSRKFDLFFCDFLQTAAPALDLAMRPRVVFEHNVEYLLRKRQWETESMPFKKCIFATEWKKTRDIEARICKSFDRVIAVSDEDRRIFENDFGVRSISTIPTGVDANYFQPQPVPRKPGRLVFVGSMDWYPNEDGVIWFLREVFPRVRKDIPHVSFAIVGRNPSATLAAAAAEAGIILTGRVPDVRPYLAEAEVVVVPLRVGGGTRIKIPEAMAMGKALVSTRIGAEGLLVRDGAEIRLEDDPETFARAVVELLQNTDRRTELENAARDCVVRDFGWESVVDRVQEILLDLTANNGLRNVPIQPHQLAAVRGS